MVAGNNFLFDDVILQSWREQLKDHGQELLKRLQNEAAFDVE